MVSCMQHFVTPWIPGPPGSSVRGIFQARILEWVAVSYFEDPPKPEMNLASAGGLFTIEPPEKPFAYHGSLPKGHSVSK